jgi:diguanylate cyclase (GGDEF)-like protein/PAS domain S-box-containing protein
MRRAPTFRPLAARGRRTIVAILVLFALLSGLSIYLSTRATARSQNRAAVVQVAARQRTLAERYVNEVFLVRAGIDADPSYTAGVLRRSARALLDGGVAPAVNGDDDESHLPAVGDAAAREQLTQEQRLVDDLVATGEAFLAGRSMDTVQLTAGETIESVDPVVRLRVVAALTENVSLNAARTIAERTDGKVADLMALQVTLGLAGLLVALVLGWGLVVATRRQTAHFRTLVTASTDLVLVFGKGGCRYVSTSVTELVGASERDLLGLGFTEYIHDDDRALLENVLQTGTPPELVFRMANRSGEWRHIDAHVTDLRDDRRVRGIVLNSRDITERVQLEEELSHRAFHDELTGLANRALFRDRLDQALRRSERTLHPVVVFLLDLDYFKQVNDSLGHDAGDQLLRELSTRLDRTLRPGDTVARLGGDEFAILLEESSEQEGMEIAHRILERLRAEPIDCGGQEVLIRASIGVVVHPGGPGSSEELIRRADVAMYAAKSGGRGRAEVFQPEMMRDAQELLGLEADLRHGLRRGEVSVHFQPSFDIEQDRIVGVEALVRWTSPTRGAVPPDRFVPLAESAGLIHELGEFVLRESVAQTARWVADDLLPPDFVTWVNLSAVQLADERVAELVPRVLAEAGVSPSRLGLEVTETAIVEAASTPRARDRLRDLHGRGIGIALDDFGTGFSSLEHLRRFPIDVIKIDRSFIQGMEHDPKDSAIAANLVSLAHALGLDVVAEGIETSGQLELLRELGCDLAQGYLLARPTPAAVVTDLLVAQRLLIATAYEASAPS